MNDIAKLLKSELGEKGQHISVKTIPDIVLKSAAKVTPSLRALVPMLGRKFRYTSQKARSQLKWSPRPVEETVLDTANKLAEFQLI